MLARQMETQKPVSNVAALFNTRFKFRVHILQLLLIVVVLGLSAARVFMKGAQPRTRATTIALGMGAKSLIIIQYQLLTEHVRRLRRWASLKANAILNGLEVVFWAAVVFLMIQANIQICVGLSCTFSWVVAGLSVVLSILAGYAFIISYLDFRYFRSNGVPRGSTLVQNDLGGESGQSMESLRPRRK